MMSLITNPPSRPMKETRPCNFADFYYEGPLDNAFMHAHQDPNNISDSQKTAAQLREARYRFAKKIPAGGNDICYLVDRAAVLDIYQQAITKIDSENHKRILSETTLKIRVILRIRKANSDDVVFTSGGMVLQPLEPQYAEPRIDSEDDKYGYRAAWRLMAWRKAGWPNVYPKAAVEMEAQIKKMTRNGRQKDVELRRQMMQCDPADWGDEIDTMPASDD